MLSKIKLIISFDREEYAVEDAIILWCSLIALLTGYPIGYTLGSMMYFARENVKEVYHLQLEVKKIPVY